MQQSFDLNGWLCRLPNHNQPKLAEVRFRVYYRIPVVPHCR